MNKYSFILISEQKEEFINNLKKIGLIHISRSDKPIDKQSKMLLDKSNQLKKALKILTYFTFDPSLDKDKSTLNSSQISSQQSIEEIVDSIFSINDKIAEIKNRIAELNREYKERSPWGHFEQETLELLEEQKYKIRYYKVGNKKFDDNWASLYPLQIISKDKSFTWFVTIDNSDTYTFPIKEEDKPEGSCSQSLAALNELKNQLIAYQKKLYCFKSVEKQIEQRAKEYLLDLDLYLTKNASKSELENHLSLFTGFAPEKERQRIIEEFNKMEALYIEEVASPDDDPPIKLKNNFFTGPFSVITGMYGLPLYNEFDPTPYISIFFLLFFAMCMGDAGYGVLLLLIALIMRFKDGKSTNKSKLVAYLGSATFVVGFLLHTFFGIDIAAPEHSFIPASLKKIMITGDLWGYNAQLILSLIVGLVHLSIAMVVKCIYSIKNTGFLKSLSTCGWTLLIVGGLVVGFGSLLHLLTSDVAKWIFIIIASLSGLAIFLLNDVKRNPLLNIGSGLWETYNTATGLLGDVLSYLRLYALGLAGGMLGNAFNSIAVMLLKDVSTPGVNWVSFIIVLLLGHCLNFSMACLGAFVHPLRLTFLEFFKNSDYQGRGKEYKPLK